MIVLKVIKSTPEIMVNLNVNEEEEVYYVKMVEIYKKTPIFS